LAKRKRQKKKRDSASDLSATKETLLRNRNQPRSDRHKFVALVMASLVAGLLLVVNFDRVTNVDNVTQLGASHHGLPFVYLKRQLANEPMIFIHGRTYSWPFPPVKGEIREWSYQNLAVDALILIAAVLVTYWLFSAIIFRYDRWRYKR
jgi:hypothetical protein